MLRALLLRPGGVPVRLVFEEGVSEDFYRDVKKDWASMLPEEYEAEPGLYEDESSTVLIRQGKKQVGDSVQTVRSLEVVDEALGHERLTVEVTLKMLEGLAGSLMLFHSAALGEPGTKNAMILVGASGKGKTTASRFYGKHFSYLSDETAIVEQDGTIRPYPKPLSIIEEADRPKAQHDPASLGLQPVAPDDFSYRVQHVVILGREKPENGERIEPRLERVHLLDALLEIVQQTSGLTMTEDGVEKLAEFINQRGGAYKLVYSEVEDTLPLMTDLLRGDFSLPAETHELEVHHHQTSFMPAEDKIQRARASSAYFVDERTLLKVNQNVFEISLFAADVWDALEEPLSQEELHQRLQELYGEIPIEEFVTVLAQLKEIGIIE